MGKGRGWKGRGGRKEGEGKGSEWEGGLCSSNISFKKNLIPYHMGQISARYLYR